MEYFAFTGRVTDPGLGVIWKVMFLTEAGGLAVNCICAMNGVGPAVCPVIVTDAAFADSVPNAAAIVAKTKYFMTCEGWNVWCDVRGIAPRHVPD